MTQKTDQTVPAEARSRRSSRRRTDEGVVIYEEFTITVCTDPVMHEFIKFGIGHERMSPSGSEDALNKTEAAAWKWNERIADRRVRKLKRLLAQIAAERDS